jgi:ubiquinol oxidase
MSTELKLRRSPEVQPETESTQPREFALRPPHLSHMELVQAQQHTLREPRRQPGLPAQLLFRLLDLAYGRRGTLSKFKVLEMVARVPYQAWEQVAYIAITHIFERGGLARRIYDRVSEARAQQDNEQWHLLILAELIATQGKREGRLRYFWLPQLLAFAYYQLSWFLYVVRPGAAYRLNADFEDHAEHEYMAFVAEHPELESLQFRSAFAPDYGAFDSVADCLRQIGHDERVHKEASLLRLRTPRFQ